ncbi:MAG TPA: DinB family protein [Candidatus Acidoferrum sp.]|nr:DinB family protein [Candidatus Acidoferrum sp.]
MKTFVAILAALTIASFASFARNRQSNSNPVSDAVRNIVAHHGELMVAAAEEMPADKYSYRPTPQSMTFGHLAMHIAESNEFLCSKISGMTAPSHAKLADTDPKDTLVEALKNSFSFCSTALGKVNDSNLGETMQLFGGRTVSKAFVMITLTDDLYDHYSAQAAYLRLNGKLPPSAQHRM